MLRINTLCLILAGLLVVQPGVAPAEALVKTEQYPTTLAYTVDLPAGYDTTRTYPLLVAIHGYADKMANYVGYAGALCPEGAIGLYPESPYQTGGGLGEVGWTWWHSGDSASWLDRSTALANSVDWILHTVEEVKQQYRVDPSKVFVYGMSQGGMLAFYLGLTHPRLFRGLLPCGGWVEGLDDTLHPLDTAALRNLPIRAFNGVDDHVVNPDTTRVQVERLRAMGVPAEGLRYPAPHTVTTEMVEDAKDFIWAQSHRDLARPVAELLASTASLSDTEKLTRLQMVLVAPDPVGRIETELVSMYRTDTSLAVRKKVLYLLGARRCLGAESLLTRLVSSKTEPQELRFSAYSTLIKLATVTAWQTVRNIAQEAAIDIVIPGSNGAKAGLIKGDVLVSYNGQKIARSADLRKVIAEVKPDVKEVTMAITRGGKRITIRLPPGRIGIQLKDQIR
jgi:predicted esterase